MYLAGCRVFRSEKLASVWNPPLFVAVVRYLFNFSIRPLGRIEKKFLKNPPRMGAKIIIIR